MAIRVNISLLVLVVFTALNAAEPASSKEQAGTGLVFAEREISLIAAPGVERLETAFVFVNRAARAETILEVKASCGCTAPSFDKTTYASGEEGKISVVFSVGERQGPQRVPVKVRTDAGEHDLILKVDIPPRFTLLPRLLFFRGGETGAKTARITYHAGTPVTLLEPRNPGAAFAVTVREVKAGAEFELSATYIGDAAQAHTTSYEVRSRDAAGREYSDRLYLRHAP